MTLTLHRRVVQGSLTRAMKSCSAEPAQPESLRLWRRYAYSMTRPTSNSNRLETQREEPFFLLRLAELLRVITLDKITTRWEI